MHSSIVHLCIYVDRGEVDIRRYGDGGKLLEERKVSGVKLVNIDGSVRIFIEQVSKNMMCLVGMVKEGKLTLRGGILEVS